MIFLVSENICNNVLTRQVDLNNEKCCRKRVLNVKYNILTFKVIYYIDH